MKILADASLPGLIQAFPAPFVLTTYADETELRQRLTNQDILLCRSTLKVNTDLLNHSQLKIVATASSGTDHVDKRALHERGIGLLDAKGSNAPAVADYISPCLHWLKDKQLNRPDKVAIIGVGAVGQQVEKLFATLGLQPLLYDPPRALQDQAFQSASLDEVKRCSLICIHAELHDNQPFPSRHLVNAAFLQDLNPGTVLINAARGGIVDETALLSCDNKLVYCTDVYQNEPNINPAIVQFASLCTPHIAGHSQEGKFEAVNLLSRKLHDLLGLDHPDFALPDRSKSARYSLEDDTQALKSAINIRETFLSLRRQHYRFETKA